MSQIMYNYPAMMAHSADMAGYAGTLQSLGADIASEQAALQAGWQGDTGMSYQAWQAQWNQTMEQLVLSYRAMAGTRRTTPPRCWHETRPRAPNGAASPSPLRESTRSSPPSDGLASRGALGRRRPANSSGSR